MIMDIVRGERIRTIEGLKVGLIGIRLAGSIEAIM
jgi:hypothetical protein